MIREWTHRPQWPERLDQHHTNFVSRMNMETFIDLLNAQVEQSSTCAALISGEQQVTYRELDQRANQLAHYLNGMRISAKGSLVGICTDRSIDMVLGILGILKAGCAYVPLDPAYPQER